MFLSDLSLASLGSVKFVCRPIGPERWLLYKTELHFQVPSLFLFKSTFKGVTFVMWQIKSGSTLLCPPVMFTPCEDLLMSCFVVWTVSGSPRGRERSCPGWGYGRKNQRNSINPGQYCWKAGFWFWVRALEIVRLYCDFSRSFERTRLIAWVYRGSGVRFGTKSKFLS